MKHNFLFAAAACFLAFGLFALQHYVRGAQGFAYASVFSNAGKNSNKEYSVALKNELSRKIKTSPESVLTFSGRDVYEVLKQPELIRHDLPTVVWQYRSASCVLDLYFTSSDQNVSTEPVVHYEIRARQPGIGRALSGRARGACVSSILNL